MPRSIWRGGFRDADLEAEVQDGGMGLGIKLQRAGFGFRVKGIRDEGLWRWLRVQGVTLERGMRVDADG